MIDATAEQILINDILPEPLRDYNRTLDKKNLQKLMTQLAKEYPEDYKDISYKLMRIGNHVSYVSGGQSFSLKDLMPTEVVGKMRKELNSEIQNILKRNYHIGKYSDDPEVKDEIQAAIDRWRPIMQSEARREAKEKGNPLYEQLTGTGSLKPNIFESILGTDLQYQDASNNPIDIPILESYSEGLSPISYFAGAYGARKGIVDLQQATQDAGYLAKQLVQIAHRAVITANDSDDPYDESRPMGYPVPTDDPDNEGSFLSHPIGGYARNTLLTPKVLQDLKKKGFDNILVRSPIVGGPTNGGLYAYDAGIREKGELPSLGDFVGISAVQSISEPLTQSAISCLHPKTLVRTEYEGLKAIKDIRVGDRVMGSNTMGFVNPVTVTNVFNNGTQPVYKTTYVLPDGLNIYLLATLSHKVLQFVETNGHLTVPKKAIVAVEGDSVYAMLADSEHTLARRTSSEFVGNIETFDIEVDHPDHLFVLDNGLVVSNSKHSGGSVGAGADAGISGFKYINQLLQVPKHFPGGAAHAELDGIVDDITEAPQGGTYIVIGDKKHYVGLTKSGKPIELLVKQGDRVEAGDVLSAGIPNPSQIVRHKGLGEGRRYFVDTFRDALKDAGSDIRRRNIETLSKGLIGYIRLNDEVGDYAPGDVMPYAMVANNWQPRDGYRTGKPSALVGQYLERPILHYTIGTKVQPSMIKRMEDFGINEIDTHPDPPPFEPEMIRGMAHVANDPDWVTRFLGAYNKNSLLEATRRGNTSNLQGTSFVPRLAFGDAFGSEEEDTIRQAKQQRNF